MKLMNSINLAKGEQVVILSLVFSSLVYLVFLHSVQALLRIDRRPLKVMLVCCAGDTSLADAAQGR